MEPPEHWMTWALGVAGAAGALIARWLIRTVVTDNKRLTVLEQRQDMQHTETMAALEELQRQVQAADRIQDRITHSQGLIAEALKHLTAGKALSDDS